MNKKVKEMIKRIESETYYMRGDYMACFSIEYEDILLDVIKYFHTTARKNCYMAVGEFQIHGTETYQEEISLHIYDRVANFKYDKNKRFYALQTL